MIYIKTQHVSRWPNSSELPGCIKLLSSSFDKAARSSAPETNTDSPPVAADSRHCRVQNLNKKHLRQGGVGIQTPEFGAWNMRLIFDYILSYPFFNMFHPFISVYDHSNRFKYVNAKPRSPNISNMPKVSLHKSLLIHHNFKWEALLGYLCMHHRYAEGVPFWDWRCWCSLGWLDWFPQSHAHSWHHGARTCQTNGPMFCTRPMDHSPLWGREPLLRSCSSFAQIDSPPRVKCWPKNSPSTSRHSSKSASLSTWPWPRMVLAHFSLASVWRCCLEHVIPSGKLT